jgi:hypothetical protein
MRFADFFGIVLRNVGDPFSQRGARADELHPFRFAALGSLLLVGTAVPTLAVGWEGNDSKGGARADLSKIDRTIKKEPAYQAKPKYCLLAFGPDAKHRIWLVLDRFTLYIDRNGNGDLTGANSISAPAFAPSTHPAHAQERSINVGDITVAGLTHTGLVVSQTQYRRKVDTSRGTGLTTPQDWQTYLDSIWRQVPDGLTFMVSVNLDPACYGLFGDPKGRRVHHFAWIDAGGQLAFADRPQNAPVLHFGGPLSLRVNPTDKLRRGMNPEQISLCLGTPGLGPGTFVNMCYDLVPKDVYPSIDVQFPAKEPRGKSLTRNYVLKERC